MKKLLMLVLPLAIAGAGCTAMSLERHTVSQSQSAADYRYQATLHALAMVAADPETLPSYAILSNGITAISDQGIANPMTTWTGSAVHFASEALAFTGSHTPQISWTVDPVADYTQLEAMRCACRWVLADPRQAGPDCAHILADPELDPSPGAHFGVADRLARLPKGWLHVGRLSDVPIGASYRAHCGDTWVWVMPDGTEGLTGFTLVLQDIATLNVTPSDNSMPANITPPLLVTLWVVQNALEPVAPVVDINIEEKEKGKVTYRNVKDNEPRPIVVVVGQTVVWHNRTSGIQTVTSTKGLFETGAIAKGADSKQILFDQAMYSKASGLPGADVILEFHSTNSVNAINPSITLSNDSLRSLYSPTLVFRVDRVIKPEFKCEIERRMNVGIGQTSPSPPVAISWEEWMGWTTPYQGQRTSVKPGASTTTPITLPTTRLAPPPGTGTSRLRGFSARPIGPLP